MDLFRGVALVGMTVFHFGYDLTYFGIREPGYTDQLHWWLLARSVAGSFLFLAGVSLYLAHAGGIHWRRWGRRLVLIALAALAVSAVTWFATPRTWIIFGILHMIAFAGVAGLVFVRLPWWSSVAAAAAVFAIAALAEGGLPDAAVWYWTGLSDAGHDASDYWPVFPWLAPVLLGTGLAKWSHEADLLRVLAMHRARSRGERFVRFLGRHSLLYYLLHQPVLIALIWTWVRLARG